MHVVDISGHLLDLPQPVPSPVQETLRNSHMKRGKVNDTSRSMRAAVALDLSQHSPLRPVSFAHSPVVNRCSPLLTLIIKPSAYVPWYILGKRGITPPLYIHKGTDTAYDSDQGNADPYTCSVS